MNNKKMARVIAICLFVLLLVSVAGACAAPAPATAPKPAPAPTTTPAPAPAPTTPALKHISILSWPMGGGAYVVAYAASSVINKHSTWLRATAVETEGTDANAKLIVEPDYKTAAIGHCTPLPVFKTNRGIAPFKQANLRFVCREYPGVAALVTLDPKIKNFPDDLVGKKIALLAKATTTTSDFETLFKVAGILDKVKISYGGWDLSKNGLLDGTIDIGIMGTNLSERGGVPKSYPVPLHQELIATAKDKLQYINIPPELLKKASDASEFPIMYGKVPAKALMPTQPEFTSHMTYNLYMSHAELDEKVVYEFLRCIYDYNDELAKINAQCDPVTKEGMCDMRLAEEFWHPGALKFYRDKGMQIPK